ncbi:MAG: FHA domain-containing protein [Planctomycetaceae bacterium]
MWQHAVSSVPRINGAEMLRLWIDGVGAFVISLKPTFTIGGPAEDNLAADWPIWSTLSRRHLEIVKTDDGFAMHPQGGVHIAGANVTSRLPLRHGTTLTLTDANASRLSVGAGDDSSVRLEFTQPHPLSLTGVLKLASPHRSVQTLDAVVLLHDCCLLGPRKSHHIVCRDWAGEVRLTSSDLGLVCQAETELSVNDQPCGTTAIVEDAATVEGDGLRFRLEHMGERRR